MIEIALAKINIENSRGRTDAYEIVSNLQNRLISKFSEFYVWTKEKSYEQEDDKNQKNY